MPDPANPQSFNRYSWVLGNPLIHADPSGHAPCGAACPGDWTNWEFNPDAAYQGPYDPRQQAANRARAEQAASLVIDVGSVAGDVKGLIEVFTGRDLVTGEDLGNWRFAGLFGLVGLGEIRYLRFADEAGGIFRSASRVDLDWVAGWASQAEKHHWIPRQFHRQLKALFPDITGDVLQFTEPLEQGFHQFAHSKWGTKADSYNELVQQWLDSYDGSQSLDDFLQFIGDLREQYLELYQQYLTGG